MGRLRNAARKEELLWLEVRRRGPCGDRIARLLCDFKLHRPLRLLLHDNRTGGGMIALEHIADPKPDPIAPAQLAVDG